MNKTTIWVIVIAAGVIAGVLVWYWFMPQVSAPVAPQEGAAPQEQGLAAPAPTAEDTTAGITSDLQDVNLGDLDKEFESVDSDLKRL